MIPIELHFDGRCGSVTWAECDGDEFVDPFFKQTLARLRSQQAPVREKYTDTSVLLEEASKHEAARPAGVILHMSRCGSTLLSNAVKASSDVVALSEAHLVEQLLRSDSEELCQDGSERAGEARRLLLSAIVTLYARGRGHTARVILKCNANTMLHLDVVREVWPTVPVIILVRDPVEVAVSNLREPAQWLRSKLKRIKDGKRMGFTEKAVIQMSAEEYCSRALGRFCEEVTKKIDTRCAVLDYRNLKPAMVGRIAELWSLQTVDARAIEDAFAVYAKDSSRKRPFAGDDSKQKQCDASPQLREMIDLWARVPYEALLDTNRLVEQEQERELEWA